MQAFILELNPNAEDLYNYYAASKNRMQTYAEMVARTISLLDQGINVCLAVYGHPGILTYPTHQAIKEARKRGHDAEMIPGISTLDCLSADLGVDLVQESCQVCEATEFLVTERRADPTAALVLFQIGAVGKLTAPRGPNRLALRALANRLAKTYSRDQEVVLYEAATWPHLEPTVQRIPLRRLPGARVSLGTTLYMAPASKRKLNVRLARQLSIIPRRSGPAR